MKHHTLNRHASREVDRRAIESYGMSGIVLMENAGRGVADRLVELGVDGLVCIVCGKGDNAGDGFVVARHLDNHGYCASVVLFADPALLSGDAATNYTILRHTGVPIRVCADDFEPSSLRDTLSHADWIVDALLGTGARGEPRPPLDEAISLMNEAEARKLAVDLPSGLDCDTGTAAPCTFLADHTCTFVASKPGFYQADGPRLTGQIQVIDIGIPRRLVADLMADG